MQHVRHTTRIRTFHPRRGRLSGRHLTRWRRLWPAYGLEIPEPGRAAPLDPTPARPGRRCSAARAPRSCWRSAPGWATRPPQMAAADPDRDYLAVEVHTPGIAHLLVAGRGGAA